MKKRLYVLIAIMAVAIVIAVGYSCTYFFELPINGIGYWTKNKEASKVIVVNVTEHITCNNGLLHIEFDLKNTDGAVKGVELWMYFKDGAPNGGNTLEERYFYVGNMAPNEVRHFSFDQLFTPPSELDKLAHEDFSIHYTK